MSDYKLNIEQNIDVAETFKNQSPPESPLETSLSH